MARNGKYRKVRKAGGDKPTTTKPKFEAPTSGHENVYFTTGSTKDAAAFQDTVRKLARHVSTAAGWKHGPVLAKAMTDLKDPVFDLPIRPVRMYYDKAGNETKVRAVLGVLNVPVMDDLDYAVETGEYSRKISRYESQIEVWADNDAKGFALVLQHCPEELEAELRNQEAWELISHHRSVVDLLVLIRDLQYNKSDRKRSIMATVEADFDLYSCAQGKQSTDEFYKVFQSTVDTINANGGRAGLHPAVFKRHFPICKEQELLKTGKALSALTPDEVDELEEKSTEAAKEAATSEYLACLFLLLSDDERFGPLKNELDNNFLMGEQEYPCDVLRAKRLMSDFVPAAPFAGRQRREQAQPTDVAFVEARAHKPICYACGKRHVGGFRECLNVTKEARDRTIELVKAGHFNKKKDNDDSTTSTKSSTSKKGGTFAVVENESDGEEEEDDDLPLPTYEEYLRSNGVISMNVGDGGQPFTGDCVSEFGIGCVEVEGATIKGVAFTDAGEWKTQGRNGSSPIKRDRIFKTVSASDNKNAGGNSAAVKAKPAWVNSITKRVIPAKNTLLKIIEKGAIPTRATKYSDIAKEMAGQKKTGIFRPVGSIKKGQLSLPVPVVSRNKKLVLAEVPTDRFTLDWWKCYLDSCATYHTFFAEIFLKNIRTGRTTMNGSCNAGTVSTSTKGWYGDFEVWLNKKGIANLLSIPTLEDAGYLVSTHTNAEWVVTTPKGKKITFERDTGVCTGMPFIDLRKTEEGFAMIETVRKSFAGATKVEIEKAYLARTVQRRIGHPPDERFKEIVSLGEGGLRNCPITVADISNAPIIYGPNRPRCRGGTKRDTKVLRVKEQRVAIPREFYRMHKMVTITADVMFINGIAFLVTLSRKLKFRTVEFVPKRTAKTLAKHLTKVLMLYARGGFIVNLALMDK